MASRLVCHLTVSTGYVYTDIFSGTAFHDVVKGKLYPAVSLKKPGEYVRANFGQTPFVYNIDDLMRVRLDDLTCSLRVLTFL